jgi:hypothetical protein
MERQIKQQQQQQQGCEAALGARSVPLAAAGVMEAGLGWVWC